VARLVAFEFVARPNRPRPVVAVGEILMWILFAVLLVPAGAVGWAIGHYTGHHGTRTVTVRVAAGTDSVTTATTTASTTLAATTTTAAAPGGANAAAGKTVFVSAGCGACHTFAPAGTSATIGPDLDKAPSADAKTAGMPLDAFVKESIVDPNKFIAKGFPKGVMPPTFGSSLSKTQLADLVAYIVAGAK
jgi:cytochrome c551/c552